MRTIVYSMCLGCDVNRQTSWPSTQDHNPKPTFVPRSFHAWLAVNAALFETVTSARSSMRGSRECSIATRLFASYGVRILQQLLDWLVEFLSSFWQETPRAITDVKNLTHFVVPSSKPLSLLFSSSSLSSSIFSASAAASSSFVGNTP